VAEGLREKVVGINRINVKMKKGRQNFSLDSFFSLYLIYCFLESGTDILFGREIFLAVME